MTYLAVFIGGGAGSLLRFLLGNVILSFKGQSFFPWSTLIINILASALLALLLHSGLSRSHSNVYALLAIGFCGGFSTFSTFSLENWELYCQGLYMYLSLNVLLSVLLCFATFYIVSKWY